MWIPTPGGHAFAWYHPPSGRARRCAVLLSDAFGWNRMVLHLTYRQLALRLAEAGFAVLRVDYPGTGDSEGALRDRARVETWIACLDFAADRLRAWSGAGELAVFGALLGASLGVALAARRPDISTLVLWGPYLQGGAAVRAAVVANAAHNSNPEGRRPSLARDGDREAFGFLLTKEWVDDLRSLNLLRLDVGAVRRALIVPRRNSAIESNLVRHLAAGGAEAELRQPPDDDLEAILQSNGAAVPWRTIDGVARWLSRHFPALDPVRSQDVPPLDPSRVVFDTACGTPIREFATFLGPNGRMFAIASEPLRQPETALAVVLVNGGHNHRAGINRNHTDWARQLAGRGHRVLRIDIRGLGDSPPSSPERLAALYGEDARHDVQDAVDWCRAHRADAIVCVGLCAGSYQAFHAALAGSSITSIVMLNPLRFHDESSPERMSQRIRTARGATRRQSAAGKILGDAARLGRKLGRRLVRWGSGRARAERRIAQSFLDLTDRGIDVCVVYNENEYMNEFLRNALRPVQHRLASSGRFHTRTVGFSDHIFSPLWVQEQVTKVVIDHIDAIGDRLAAARCHARGFQVNPSDAKKA